MTIVARQRLTRWAGRGFFGRRSRVRVVFALLVIFQVAQVSWWLIFQRDYVTAATSVVEAAWTREARLANLALDAARPEARAGLRAAVSRDFAPLDARLARVAVAPAALSAFQERQTRYLAMFAYEGPFFMLVILVGLYLIGVSFRSDQELKRRQRNFLMAASHEFRTPLSTMRLLVQTIERRNLPPERERAYISQIGSELTRLEGVGARVLASARLAQAPAAALEVADLRDLVRAMVEDERAGLEARGARLEVLVAAEPVSVAVDAGALALAISNLLDNAVKYNPRPHKPVRVRVAVRRTEGLISVEDEGLGVPADELENIFEQFYRAGSEATRETAGLGLGLHLVRSVAEQMGGWVACERLEQGARFTLGFPLARSAA